MAFASLDAWGFHAPAPIRTLDHTGTGTRSLAGETASAASAWWWCPPQQASSQTALGAEATPVASNVRVHHASPSDPHRLALSGRLADVCAELDRLLAAAETCDLKA